jgi:predicted Na+-dependent transporter
MEDIIKFVFNFTMIAFVIGYMVKLGLGLTLSQIIKPFKNIKMVILALVANFVVVPLFALAMVWVLPVSEGVRIGIILLSLGGGAPFIPMIVQVAKGKMPAAVGLMILLLITTIFFMPIAVPLMLPGASVSAWGIAKSLILTMLIPLGVALVVKVRFPTVADRIKPFIAKFTNLNLLVLVVAMLFLYGKIIMTNIGVIPIVMIFFLGAATIGYLSGGTNKNARMVLLVGTGLRNPPIAVLVASQNFSTKPMAAIVPLLVIIVGLSILFPLAKKIGNKTR